MPAILIVDDDAQIRDLLSDYLSGFGMTAEAVADGVQMEEALKRHAFDLIILDLMLPGEDGLSLCRRLRAKSGIPILMLTARGETTDRIVGLEVGADDYIAKPFEPRELVARIQSILRRTQGHMEQAAGGARDSVSFAGWTLQLSMRQLVSDRGTVVPLSNAEFRLLSVFLEHPNRVLSRDFLLEEARGRNMDLFDRSIDILVSRLRQKLHGGAPGEDAASSLIKTVRGEGYLFDATVKR
jgi:two-component system OmpR family response regulator